jgi:hypothetical protein
MPIARAGIEYLAPTSGISGLSAATVAAAGTNQATATQLTLARNYVESGTGGVKLPQAASFGGSIVPVYNRSGATFTVYPYLGDTLETNAVNVGFTLANNQTGYFSVDNSGVVRMA